MIYSIGCGKKIYDLGSGLNMYRVEILKSGFYTKYKDNLMFNYCMVLGQAFYNYKVKFFPILWREDDQVSNVKMVSQAMIVLKLLFSYVFSTKKFISAEHRDKYVEDYSFKVEYTNS